AAARPSFTERNFFTRPTPSALRHHLPGKGLPILYASIKGSGQDCPSPFLARFESLKSLPLKTYARRLSKFHPSNTRVPCRFLNQSDLSWKRSINKCIWLAIGEYGVKRA